MNFKLSAATACLTLLTTVAAQAAATPIPGGANQVSALSVKVGQTVFNGMLRITVLDVRDATPAETAKFEPAAGQKVMHFDILLRNGTSSDFTDLIEYTFADRDAISVEVPTVDYTHANLNIQQGAAQRQSGNFAVDPDFVPVKMIVKCVTCGSNTAFKTLRVSIPH